MNPLQMLGRPRVARNVNEVYDASATFGDRLADGLARFGGSWTFILLFVAALVLWMGVNSLQLLVRPFDPYPFIFLNLVLSCLAAVQAPVIMMSQNRQAARDRLEADHDYQVNLKAESEIEELHRKLDALRADQWAELIELQRQQLACLEQLLQERRRQEPNGRAPTGVSPSSRTTTRHPRRRAPAE